MPARKSARKADWSSEEVKKRGPGRPKGSPNKAKSGSASPKKRGPGRPKGSPNKKSGSASPKKRGPGRPKGSPNKAKHPDGWTGKEKSYRLVHKKQTPKQLKPWLNHLDAFQAKHPNMTRKEAMKAAKATYKRK